MRSKINRRLLKHIGNLSVIVFLLFFGLSFGKIQGTNSYFTDSANVSGSEFSAGYWMPHLEMAVNPVSPDGSDGWYKTKPCITLTASITDPENTEIFYRLKSSDSYAEYPGTCVVIPDGEWSFDAYAIYAENPEWKSNPVSNNFKVNTLLVEVGDVIINEVMWMGSQKDDGTTYSADEWIEIKNTTGHGIDIKNWNINGIKKGGHFEFAGGSSVMIPAGGYLLISEKDDGNSLIDVSPDFTTNNFDFENNYTDHGKITLTNKSGIIIDETPNTSGSDWPAGKNENHMRWSMERNNDGDGWHTCDPNHMTADEKDTMKNYWDSNAGQYNCGTPKHSNLSSNDSSSEDYDENLANLDSAGTSNLEIIPAVVLTVDVPVGGTEEGGTPEVGDEDGGIVGNTDNDIDSGDVLNEDLNDGANDPETDALTDPADDNIDDDINDDADDEENGEDIGNEDEDGEETEEEINDNDDDGEELDEEDEDDEEEEEVSKSEEGIEDDEDEEDESDEDENDAGEEESGDNSDDGDSESEGAESTLSE